MRSLAPLALILLASVVIRRSAGVLRASAILLCALTLLPATTDAQVIPCPTEPTDMAIGYGDVIQCSIDVAGDSDVFRFNGTAGESILVQGVIGDSSSVRPCIELVAPNNAVQQACANAFVNRIDTTLAVGGTYTIRARDRDSVFTGAYTLALERLIPPSVRARPIQYGQGLQDQVDIRGDIDVFFFGGAANDFVALNVSKPLQSSVRPCIELIAPDNSRRVACNNAFSNRLETLLGQTGTFAVLVRDMSNAFTGGYLLDLQCLSGICTPPTAAPPGPPQSLSVVATGSTVTLTWLAPASGGPAASYVIEAGGSPGATNFAVFDTGTTATSFTALGVGAGTYFLRIRARNASGTSAPSNEVVLVVGGAPGPCTAPPGAPGGLTAAVNGSLVQLRWNQATGQTSTYVIQAGSSPGASDLASFETGSLDTALLAAAPPGVYFVRVLARNLCGTSGASNEVVVVVQ